MKKTIYISISIIIIIGLSGCAGCTTQIDKQKQIELFNNCLIKIPNGPEKTMYNDWDEVVHACNRISIHQSREEICWE